MRRRRSYHAPLMIDRGGLAIDWTSDRRAWNLGNIFCINYYDIPLIRRLLCAAIFAACTLYLFQYFTYRSLNTWRGTDGEEGGGNEGRDGLIRTKGILISLVDRGSMHYEWIGMGTR